MEKLKKLAINCLLAFVFISIGFSFGKHSVRANEQISDLPVEINHKVIVYYLHSTFRCVTCNTIEKMTKELLDKVYKEELNTGKISFLTEDFQKNDKLAKKFEVVSSCVVIAEVKNGVIIDYNRLDDVWTTMEDPYAFNRYIKGAIDLYLKKVGGDI